MTFHAVCSEASISLPISVKLNPLARRRSAIARCSAVRCGFPTSDLLGQLELRSSPRNCADPLKPPPQTQGKAERFHQTLKKWLERHDEFSSIEELQAGVDFFSNYYNEIRPHQAHGRPPLSVYNERDKAAPLLDGHELSPTTKVRRDRVDKSGRVTLRHRSRLHHIGVGREHKFKRVLMLVADLDVRIVDDEGTILRHLTLDPSKDYQPMEK